VVERGTADVQRHVQRHLEVMGSIPIVSFCKLLYLLYKGVNSVVWEMVAGRYGRWEGERGGAHTIRSG
jgi:hypothetical protein